MVMIYGVSQKYKGVGYEVRVKWCKVVVSIECGGRIGRVLNNAGAQLVTMVLDYFCSTHFVICSTF